MVNHNEVWLDTAVSGIRFKPDRIAVRKELAAHMEDKISGLQRSFPDLSDEEARDLALSGMGDPEEVKRSLAKIHRPWLGYLWEFSHWAAYLCLVALTLIGLASDNSFSLWGRGGMAEYTRVKHGESAQAGQYTFRIVGADYVQWPDRDSTDPDDTDNLRVVLRVSGTKFWEPLDFDALRSWLSAAGPDGVWYPMENTVRGTHTITDGSVRIAVWRYKSGVSRCRWGPGWQEFNIWLPAAGWSIGDRVTLRLDSPAGKFSLSALVMDKVVSPS